jgi:phage terminase large subunit-like protein
LQAINYTDIAASYAVDVLAGKILACKWVRAACQRQVGDLLRQSDPAWPFRFDEAKAARVCRFVASLPHVKGPLTGQKIALEPWQIFILTTIFGWINKATGFRRFRRVYIEIPRGNAKSTLSSGIALYMLAADSEGGAEVYSAARTKEQASIVFNDARKMLRSEASAKLREKLGLQALEHSISHSKSGSVFKALASENGALDGLATHFACLDELHAHGTRDVYDVLETSLGKRTQSLLWSITTAGSNLSGICAEVRDRITKILDTVFDEPTVFGIIYTIDAEDDWSTEEAARKANPNYGISVFADDLEQKLRAAKHRPSLQAAYKTKHLNVWVQTDAAWMDMAKFLRCSDPALNEADFAGQPCVVGVDLASKLDILAMVRLYPQIRAGKLHVTVFADYWTPEARIESSPNASYRGWAASGALRTCEGEVNDYEVVADEIRSVAKQARVLEVATDPYESISISTPLMREGLKVVDIPQMPKNLSGPMKEIESLVYDSRFHFDGDPVLAWAVSNVVCHEDKNGNYFPNKARPENKIDPASAVFTAMNRVIALHSTGELARDPNDRVFVTVF